MKTPWSYRQFLGSALGMLFMLILLIPSILSPVLSVLFPEAQDPVFPRKMLAVLALEHLWLSLAAAGLATIIGIGVGIAATRPAGRTFLPLVRDASALAQTVPPAAVLALAIPFVGFGFQPVLLALVLYSVLPVLDNTLAGLENLPSAVLEAAQGMGMTRFQVLLQIELPLALPVISAGIRTSVVINVGTATIGALAGAGGLGSPIVAGLIRDNPAWVFQGAAASALMALFLNGILGRLEKSWASHSKVEKT